MSITEEDRVVLSGHDVEAELLEDWRLLFARLHARFDTGDFATALQIAAEVGAVAEEMDHHPDIDLSYGRLDVRLSSHDVGGVTQRDVRLAREISRIAGSRGATPRPRDTAVLELALDTPDAAAIRPFWAALLGYEGEEEDELADPGGRGPTIWFQQAAGPTGAATETPSQTWHLDVRVPPEVAELRIQAVLDAGGTMVSDGRAPSFWVLADAQGNRACVTTWVGREPA
ncbi:4a-hydroxytetrahydrobiopterin dehydratase [Nocardioides sp. R-C-SC26]|uniref:4a-hydroxytetrahydrobiopterin dehydratase n=1 Tax=Nocardioides sp. R-C-SC26 TaxID=2870414 RepID=UPI001E29D087|nr:4a-hydroxytetrahydrobiopterin dehydratase [Nocardioides sp. R-C-SC26]